MRLAAAPSPSRRLRERRRGRRGRAPEQGQRRLPWSSPWEGPWLPTLGDLPESSDPVIADNEDHETHTSTMVRSNRRSGLNEAPPTTHRTSGGAPPPSFTG